MMVKEVLENDRYREVDLTGGHRRAKKRYDNVIAVDRMKPWAHPGGVSDFSDDREDDENNLTL